MAAEVVEIADAVALAINAASLSLSGFTAARSYLPVHDLADLADGVARVDVVPRGRSSAVLDRNSTARDLMVEVVVQRKVEAGQEEANGDACLLLVEEIEGLFFPLRLDGYPSARCVAAVNEPMYAPETLDDLGLFASALLLTFRIWG